jgi:hypothetical protein
MEALLMPKWKAAHSEEGLNFFRWIRFFRQESATCILDSHNIM